MSEACQVQTWFPGIPILSDSTKTLIIYMSCQPTDSSSDILLYPQDFNLAVNSETLYD